MAESLHTYSLSVKSIPQHLFNVKAKIAANQKNNVCFSLPAWIPGSYMIRDFAKNIVSFNAYTEAGESLAFKKEDKQTWSVNNGGSDFFIDYDIYAFDLSVRSAFINDEYAFANGTSLFLQPSNKAGFQLQINIANLDPSWAVHTGMPQNDDGYYYCEDYNAFIDYPILIGKTTSVTYEQSGVSFDLVFTGDVNLDLDRMVKDLRPICSHHIKLFGSAPPVSNYVFLTLLSDKGFGGLEHRNSTALLYPRFDLPMKNESSIAKTDEYITFLSLCCHELFHTWHVKRLRPDVMIEPDLSKETYTDQLWIYEGITSFYDDVTLARAGVITPEDYCKIISKSLTRIIRNNGRFKQSVAESSYDAWTKFYQQDASATNNIVSYYTKGCFVALGLDLLLRDKSNNTVTLDHLMKVMWSTFGINESGTPNDVIQVLCKQHFNIDVTDYLNACAYGTKDVPLETWAANIGLNIAYYNATSLSDTGASDPVELTRKRTFGATLSKAPLGVKLMTVRENTPASHSGLMVNDVIVAINGYIASEKLIQRMIDSTESSSLDVSVVRDGRLLTMALPIETTEADTCSVTIVDKLKFENWLSDWNQ